MLIDTWLLQHAVELADQAGVQLAAVADALGREAHSLLEEVTGQSSACSPTQAATSVNAGCCDLRPS